MTVASKLQLMQAFICRLVQILMLSFFWLRQRLELRIFRKWPLFLSSTTFPHNPLLIIFPYMHADQIWFLYLNIMILFCKKHIYSQNLQFQHLGNVKKRWPLMFSFLSSKISLIFFFLPSPRDFTELFSFKYSTSKFPCVLSPSLKNKMAETVASIKL